VTRRKKEEYVLNDAAMRDIYVNLGTEGTQLAIRDESGAEARRLSREELMRVIEILSKLEELIRVVERRGIDFADFLAERDSSGRFPIYRVVVDGQDRFFHDVQQRDDFLEKENLLIADEEMTKVQGEVAPDAAAKGNGKGRGDQSVRRLQKNHELHEVKEMEKLFAQLENYGLLLDDWFLTQEESVSGEKLPTKYALHNEDKAMDVAGVGALLLAIVQLGKQGIEVKRFKGLGEMNSEELWETTLDPNKRVLLRVTLQEAGEAERMFSVLMGEDVERRRQFIEDHALEVKNLDV
jgi:DNA gyrase subunit B